jgi:predicted kinase
MRRLLAVAALASNAAALAPYAKQIKLPQPELQSWLARDVGRRRQELQALAWLGRAHRVLPSVFDKVFTVDRYANAPWYACDDDGKVYGTLKTGTAVVARGVPVSFSLSRDCRRMAVLGLGCDLRPRIPANASVMEERDAERLCQQLVASKRILIDAIETAVFDVLEPALAGRPTFEATGDVVEFTPRRDLFAREGSSEKWLQCVSEYYFAAASLQEVAPVGSDVRFVFYYDATEPLNSEDVRRNVNPEIICCRLPEADGAASLSCGTALVVLLVMILLTNMRSTTPRPCRRRRVLANTLSTPPSPLRRRRALAPMRRFLVLASLAGSTSALQPLTKPPRLIVLAGLPGSGKSSLAAALEKRGWAVVNQDSLGNRRKCERACARAFERGDRVVIDRCNHDRSQRAHWTRILERAGGGYKVAVWLTTPVDSCVERVLARPVHPTLAGPGAEKVVRSFERSFDPPRDDEVDAIIKLAPTDDYDSVAAALDPKCNVS